MNKNPRAGLRTWIEVERKAIKHNFGVFKKLIAPKVKLMAVVKSNAYGHGLVGFSREVEKLGADFLGVDSITEALALRREGITLPILVLGYTLPEMIAPAASADISLTVSSLESLSAALKIKTAQPLRIHIKVDTGMHRQGFLLGDLAKILAILKSKIPARLSDASRSGGLNLKSPSILIEGLYTHFASAKNPAFPKDTKEQIAEFKKWIAAFRAAGFRPTVHAAATAGTLLFPDSHFDMVRVGIGLYGLWPAREVKAYFHGRMTLRPALAWKSLITEVKRLPAGSRIGYDLTEVLEKDSVVGIVPVGYWHGYPRALSSIGRVLVKGQMSKVLGRVSMDMLTVDLTGIRGAKVGDEITLLSRESESPASAEGIALLTDSSWYEVITRLNPLIKRLYH